jgi:Tol biopolymer transport system component
MLELRRIATSPVAAPPERRQTSWPRRELLAWTLLASALIALVVLLSSSRRTRPGEPRLADPIRFALTPPPGSAIVGTTISPDGRQIALAAVTGGRAQLWLRAIGGIEARPIAGTEEVTYHFWSPDSRVIGFFAQGKLKTVDVANGTITVICNATNARGGAWGADRTIVFAAGTGEGLFRVSANGGVPLPQTVLDPAGQESSHRWPAFLPDGRHFVYLARSGRPEKTGIYVGSVDSPGVRRLVNAISNAAYAPPGFLLFVRGTALLAQPFDAVRLEMAGEPATVLERAGYDSTLLLADFSVSENGVGVFAAGERNRSELVWFNRGGTEVEVRGQPGAYANISLSRDDGRIAAAQYASGSSDIWVFDSSRSAPSRLTFDPSHETHPIWSPDGQQIAFGSDRNGFIDLYRKSASGGKEDVLLASNHVKYASDWSRDGRYLVYDQVDPETKLDVWVLPLFGDRKPFPFLQTPTDEWLGHLSPDGRWMAYTSNESGRYEIYVQSFPPSGAKWQISAQGGLHPRWSHDEKELFYIASDQKLMAVPVRSGGTLEYGVPVPLFDTRIANVFAVRAPYEVARDGRRFLLTRTVSQPGPPTVVVNWSAGLNR